MIIQILAIVGFYTMIYLLLRLHRFILAQRQDKRKYNRAYLVGFDETDWDSDQEGDLSGEPDSKGATRLDTARNNDLIEWPTELDL